MSDIFYYIGFLYILDSLRTLYISFKPIVDKEKTLNISDQMSTAEMIGEGQKYMAKNKLNIMKMIVGMIFFIWAVVGYVGNTHEKYWFLLDIIFIAIPSILAFSAGVFLVIQSTFKHKAKIYNDSEKKTINIPLGKIVSTAEIIIISIILYQHFFAN